MKEYMTLHEWLTDKGYEPGDWEIEVRDNGNDFAGPRLEYTIRGPKQEDGTFLTEYTWRDYKPNISKKDTVLALVDKLISGRRNGEVLSRNDLAYFCSAIMCARQIHLAHQKLDNTTKNTNDSKRNKHGL